MDALFLPEASAMIKIPGRLNLTRWQLRKITELTLHEECYPKWSREQPELCHGLKGYFPSDDFEKLSSAAQQLASEKEKQCKFNNCWFDFLKKEKRKKKALVWAK